MASELSDPSDLTPSTDGNEVQKLLGSIADRAKEDKFLYTKFFAIGLFRLLELTGKQALLCMVYMMPMNVDCIPTVKLPGSTGGGGGGLMFSSVLVSICCLGDAKALCLCNVSFPSMQDELFVSCCHCVLCQAFN